MSKNHHKEIAGIILAAGESKRLGTAKQLLSWKKRPLIWHVTRLAIEADLQPIIVVTGSTHEAVEEVIKGFPVLTTYNDHWQLGQSSSIKRGLEELPVSIQACIFLLSDQPQIPKSLLMKIKKRYKECGSTIIAPRVNGRRGNPVLFDHRTFNDLSKLKGNEGGRTIFDKYEVDYIEWDDESILLDVDTKDSYKQLLRIK